MADAPENSHLPFIGYVETTMDALRVIQAAFLGVIPRVAHRLNELERKSYVTSGSVFVFQTEESGIQRWTDGLFWSPSRVDGNFLLYVQMSDRLAGKRSHAKKSPHSGSLKMSLVEKANGLRKRTFSINIKGIVLHLISYFTPEDIQSNRLMRPSLRPDIMDLHLCPTIFRLDGLRVQPVVVIGVDSAAKFVEIEESDSVHLTAISRQKDTSDDYLVPAQLLGSSQQKATN
ncbi:Gti1/Pac2 family-domain-containing protein [Mycena sp. CBHHK59/15]|nr:Gti1/Pac2 family-domain-containing protein [Mycena sp. CBHHK59/15]